MNEQLKKFIEDNINLIEQNEWKEIYHKRFPEGFTETLLDCGINPLDQGLNFIPNNFLYNSNIEEFTIPNNITSIGKQAFAGCSNLINIKIPNSVKIIGDYAFSCCYQLASIEIPNKVTSIGHSAFEYCHSLTNIVIGNGVKSIQNWVFLHSDSLISIKYNGTKAEWNNIKKDNAWTWNSAIQKIICTDGEILL